MESLPKSKRLNLRGYLTVFVMGAMFICADLIERTVVVAVIKVRPSAREGLLDRWQRIVSRTIVGIIQRVGGVPFEINAAIPWGPGVLVVMNHQSLIDIPVAFACVVGGYSKIITRERYRTGFPLVSHMIRLYDHPTVRPGERMATEIHRLRELAVTSDRPIIIFPEGRRSPNGDIRRFRTAGLKTMLSARTWTVYAVVADGLWRSARVGDFLENVNTMQVNVEELGPFEFDHETGDADRFIADLERDMREKLTEMRRVCDDRVVALKGR